MIELEVESLVCRGAHDDADASLAEAIQTVFSLEDRALLLWNGISIPLGLKYDVSMMIDDVITMISAMVRSESGTLRVEWPSSGFPYEWLIVWAGEVVEISATARDEPGAEDLSGRAHVRLGKERFVLLWRKLLAPVLHCLEASGYSANQIEDLVRLREAALAS